MKAPHIIMVTISNKAMMKVFSGEILLTAKESMDKATEAFEANVRGEMFPIFSEFASCGEVPDLYNGYTSNVLVTR